MAKFSSPQEIEAAEEAAEEQQQEAAEEQEQKESQKKETTSEEEPTTTTNEESEQGEETTEEDMSSELDDILSDHSDEPVVETEDGEEGVETGEPSEREAYDLEITNDRFEEITSDPEKFQEFIRSVRQDAVAEAEEKFDKKLQEQSAQLREEILQNIPEVVKKTTQRTQSVNSLRKQFFESNPELKNKLGYVRDMTNTVSHNNPDWSAEQVLNEVARRAQRDLNISQQATEREKQRNSQAKFAGAGGRQSPGGGSDKRGKQAKLMDDTFN